MRAFKPDFGNFADLDLFVAEGGQKGVQRPVLPPGTMAPIHPVGFLIITKLKVYGVPVSPELKRTLDQETRIRNTATTTTTMIQAMCPPCCRLPPLRLEA